MNFVYATAAIVLGLTALLLTSWTVDRLSASSQHDNLPRSWRRPLAIVVLCSALGASIRMGFDGGTVVPLAFVALIGVHLWCRVGVGVHVVEALLFCGSIAGAMLFVRWIAPGAVRQDFPVDGVIVAGALKAFVGFALAGSVSVKGREMLTAYVERRRSHS